MPVIRINAQGNTPRLHQSPRPIAQELSRHDAEGPVIIMIHGYKYRPGSLRHCPHLHLLALHPMDMPWRTPSWPRQLGFGTGHASEGLAIAFGWNARGAPWVAQRRALQAGVALARVILQVRQRCPHRPVHILAHSMGIELVLEALLTLPKGSVDRVIAMSGASYQSRALAALSSDAGRSCEMINITSRENDMFDFVYERLIAPPEPRDRAIGAGLDAANTVTLQLDCAGTLDYLAHLGAPIGAPERRICHWSSYTRPGILRFYNDLLREPHYWSLTRLRRGLPKTSARRWSRLFAPPSFSPPLLQPQKAS